MGGGETFDLIFLDGDHSAKAVYGEIPLALKRLNPGGVIVLHDFFPNGRPLWEGQAPILGSWLATARFQAEKAGFEVVPLGALPWDTKLGSRITSLAVVSQPLDAQ